jgi:hypothetical protein
MNKNDVTAMNYSELMKKAAQHASHISVDDLVSTDIHDLTSAIALDAAVTGEASRLLGLMEMFNFDSEVAGGMYRNPERYDQEYSNYCDLSIQVTFQGSTYDINFLAEDYLITMFSKFLRAVAEEALDRLSLMDKSEPFDDLQVPDISKHHKIDLTKHHKIDLTKHHKIDLTKHN